MTLKTIDEDEGQEFLYKLVEDESGMFSIVNSSLVSSVKFNFEEDDWREFRVKVQSQDNGSPHYSVSA